jgi:hypothetical protein
MESISQVGQSPRLDLTPLPLKCVVGVLALDRHVQSFCSDVRNLPLQFIQ